MSLSKAEIITLVKTLARQDDLDDDMLADDYADVIEEVAQTEKTPLVAAEMFDIVLGTSTYDYDASAVRVLYVFVDDTLLRPADIIDLETYNVAWRALSGTPYSVTEAEITSRTLRLIPIPNFDSDPLVPTHGEPFGEDYPANIGVQIFAAKRDTDIPDWLALFVAMRMLANIYGRPSAYKDAAFSSSCDDLAKTLWKAAGL